MSERESIELLHEAMAALSVIEGIDPTDECDTYDNGHDQPDVCMSQSPELLAALEAARILLSRYAALYPNGAVEEGR